MSKESGDGADIGLELGGQKLNVRNVKSLNTVVTLLTFVLVSVIAYALWAHGEDSKAASAQFVGAIKEQTAAIKEQTVVQREQNCLIAMPTDRRDVELCRRIAR